MNNMGGILWCELIAISAIETFEASDTEVTIQLNNTQVWEPLPISLKQTSAGAEPRSDEGGTIYTHQLITILPYGHLKKPDITFLKTCCQNGCLAKYADANGKIHVLGSKDYPLTGNLQEISGKTPTDLAGYQLQLSAQCLTQQLKYLT